MFNVIIIGAGSIGALKDEKYDNKKSAVKTHAHAIWSHGKFNLIGVVDSDYEKAIKAANKWDTKPYHSISEIKEKADIIIIASSTSSHLLLLNEISITKEPMIIICEKPFCDNYKSANIGFKKFFSNLIPISVNYVRRYSPEIQVLRNDLFFGNFGKIYSCTINYSRGLMRDGCHAIDLCNWFFGKFKDGQILGKSKDWIIDEVKDDPIMPIWMKYEKCKNIFMAPVDNRKCVCFEFHIITDEGKIVLDNSCQGFKFYPVRKEPVYGNFKSLDNQPLKNGEISLTDCFINMLDNISEHLDNNKELLCTAQDAIEVHKVMEYLKNKR